jgi:hypothetical protein
VNLSRFALLLVVFIDVMGFGLILPIFTTILLDPSQDFLPADTPRATRQFDYGVVIAVFFLFYFFWARPSSPRSPTISGASEGS